MNKILILVLSVTVHVLPQFVVKDERLVNGTYTMTISNQGVLYSDLLSQIQEIGNNNHGEEIPSGNIFISLPSGIAPEMSFTVTKRKEIRSDSHIAGGGSGQGKIFLLKGYVRIGDAYCAHLAIRPLTLDKSTGRMSEVTDFTVTIKLPKSISPKNSAILRSENVLFDNKRYGGSWITAPPMEITPQSDSWINYDQEYIKLGVAADGIYRLTRSDLLSYGVSVQSVNPQSIKLFLRGKEIPVTVSGEQDGSFDESDFVEFVGRRNYGSLDYRKIAATDSPFNEYLNMYSDTAIYWLTWSDEPGKRVKTAASPPALQTDTLRYYDHLLHLEKNVYWDFSLSGGDLRRNYPEIFENETWHEGNLSVGVFSVPFTISNLYPGKPARAFVKLQDYASSIFDNAHLLALKINSTGPAYDSGYIDKYQGKVLQAIFSSSMLKNGQNSVDVHSYFVPDNSINTVIRDWYELEYPRYTASEGDSITLTYATLASSLYTNITVTDFNAGSFSLYRFRQSDSSIVKLTEAVLNNSTVTFSDTVKNGNTYFLIGSNKASKPFFFYKKKFSNLRLSSRKAEYIAITHPVFLQLATSYASFIASSYGITTTVVNVNDIYDEYNFGFLAPEPIRSFLQSTHLYWQPPKPKYVFIIGKATYDYYGNKSKYFGAPKLTNFVPSYGNPVSDNWFILWDTTSAFIPQMSIGRVPAKTTDEFQSYFLKHQKYAAKGYDDWNKRYIFFSGGNFTDPDQITAAKNVNEFIINNYVRPAPIGGIAANFYKTVNPITNFGPYDQDYINSSIDDGGVFISYIGHSGTQTWDNSITDISQLANIRDRHPLISDFGCSTAKFAEPDILSFSELAVNSNQGQAISYIGNSSLGFTSTAYSFPQIFYKKLLIDTSASLGDVHRLAKIDYVKQFGTFGSYGLFIKTNSLIGDPIVSLQIPVKPNISLSDASVSMEPEQPTDQSDSISVLLRYFNYGKSTGDSMSMVVRDEYQGAINYYRYAKRAVPLYADSLWIKIPIKGLPGGHRLTVIVDSVNAIQELNEFDNSFSTTIIVASSTLRNTLFPYSFQQTDGKLLYINPSSKTHSPSFTVEISENRNFSPKQSFLVQFDTFATKVQLDPQFKNKRIWLRSKIDETSPEGLATTVRFGNTTNILFNDSAAFEEMTRSNVKMTGNGLRLDTNKIHLSVISAGRNDGNTAVILKNNQNYVPENTLRGHHIALFHAGTYEFVKYFYFPIHEGTPVVTSYLAMLDSVTSEYLVAFSISNEGQEGLSADLRNAIKSYGSKYIDSVMFWSSWAYIGKKGALTGSMPEKVSHSFQGRVQIDTTISVPNKSGSILTPVVGPVSSWKSIEFQYSKPAGSNITVGLIGIKKDLSVDTVMKNVTIDSLVDISSINAEIYPQLKLFSYLTTSAENISPAIISLAVNYTAIAELGSNEQVFKGFHTVNSIPSKEITPTDTIVQGEKLQFTFRVYNVGSATAKNVPVSLVSTWDNNYVEGITAQNIDSIPPDSYKEIIAQYNTSLGSGKRTIRLSIDADSTIRELYKDNNYYSYPIIIKKSSGNPLLPNLVIGQHSVIQSTGQLTDDNDTALFSIVYSNAGSLVNDSIAIQVKHYYRSNIVETYELKRKYPVSYDTVKVRIPIKNSAGEHQLSVDIDYNGRIVESSETDNFITFYFSVATSEFKILFPPLNSIAFVEQMVFLNPTVSVVNSVVEFEIDTLSNYAAPVRYLQQMRNITTHFALPGLKKKKRYYWRVKIQNSAKEWTSGSFYCGDSTAPSIGQVDTASWRQNSYTHTAYVPDSGARIIDTKTTVKASSAGFLDGNTGIIELNGVNVIAPILGSGHHVMVFDSARFTLIRQRRFTLGTDPNEADSLVQFIQSVPSNYFVIDVVVDDGANNLSVTARNALKGIGSAYIDQLSFRDSWAIIGRKGAPAGSVPEKYQPSTSGIASAETVIVRSETSGFIETPVFGPFSSFSELQINQDIPAGAQSSVQFIGLSSNSIFDTLLASTNQNVISLAGINTKEYRFGKLLFHLIKSSATKNSDIPYSAQTPSINNWKISANMPSELAVSMQSTMIDRNQVMEGEPIQFSSKIFNVSMVAAESVLVRLKKVTAGIQQTIKEQRYNRISSNDSAAFSFTYDSRGQAGNHAFTFEVDPYNGVAEQTKDNNSSTLPYTVLADTTKPALSLTVDGTLVVNGDYVGRNPDIRIRYSDNNPSSLIPADTSNFIVRLNGVQESFGIGKVELLTSNSPGRADLRWTPELMEGENVIQVSAKDIAGNYSDTIVYFVNVATKLMLRDIYNLPNPFNRSTHFTFNLAAPSVPDEITIKIFTVTGRLIQEISSSGNIGFNKIPWDGRDRDGDEIGNGVYLYKVIVKQGGNQIEGLSKFVKMR